ncbi:MAG: heme ABC exporter ATP-binding protein CcmA [Proteobacteria bacterium]|nr:heme ABC exporter ATP-binding protein CcmA [Pseudomonadota bacterium]
MNQGVLELVNVSCQKGGETLFQPVSLVLKKQQMYLMAGPNGIGKTTLMEVIAGLGKLHEGTVVYPFSDVSYDISQWFQLSTYLGHKLGNKASLNCLENLRFIAEINQLKVTDHQLSAYLDEAGLGGYEYFYAGDLSAGQNKRLALIRLALLKKPFWLLDEPFVNLDHAGCDWLYHLIKQHLSDDGAVLITAHDQLKIKQMAHDVVELSA